MHISHIYAANHPRNRNEGDAGKRCPNHPDRYDIPRRFTVSQKESIVTCTFPACYPGNQQQYAIYSYLGDRIGKRSYKTGASFFLLSKIVGAAARLYLVVLILQHYVFSTWNIPFWVTVIISIFLVWLYTYRSGIKTIIWTDTLQALCLVAMLVVIIWKVKDAMELDMEGMVQTLTENPHFRIFEFNDWHSTQHFVKQFFSGIFITIVMTGLDQDMMQKNLSCKSLKDAQKNMYTYGFAYT